MRISTDPHDKGHAAFIASRGEGEDIRVFLDGRLIEDVVTADEDKGCVVTFNRNEDGSIRAEDGACTLTTRHGRVRVVRITPIGG